MRLPTIRSMVSTKTTCNQLYAYGKGYGCDAVALIYPRSQTFTNKDKLRYQILDDLTLICLPFDVAYPKESVQRSMEALTGA